MSDYYEMLERNGYRDGYANGLRAGRAELAAELAAAEERGRLQGQFSPIGDNHHNAAACPYCGDLLTRAEERGRRSGVESAQLAVDAVVAVCDSQQDVQYRNGALMAAEAVRKLAPRDSAPAEHYDVPCICGDGAVDITRCPAHRPGRRP